MGVESEIPVVMLMGPTASGKTGLSLQLCERWSAEIVSVDSAQVYRGMDIGTAKPDAATRARVPHHLIDILDPAESYSAARFRDDALRLIAGIRSRGRVPLLAGGTMLYFRALQAGLSDLPSARPEFRRELEKEAARLGWPVLYSRLAQRDPQTAARLHPNDQQRIQRALEIVEIAGATPSEFRARPKPPGIPGRVLKLGLELPRAELHARIEQRLRAMMKEGFLEEVAQLRQRGDLHAELPAMRAVGYHQLWEFLDGQGNLDQAVQRCIEATRQFAKRQLTWMRKEPDVLWLDALAPELASVAARCLQ